MQFLSKLCGGAGSCVGENAISVITRSPVYLPGDLVQGYIVLDVKKAIKIDSVNLTIYGKESTSYTIVRAYIHNAGPMRMRASKKHVILKAKACLVQLGQVLDPGQYLINFQYQLPTVLPGSVRIDGLPRNGRGNIEYRIEASAFVSGLFKSDLCHCVYLVIEQPCPKLTLPVKDQMEKDLSGCCFSGGSVSVALLLEKSMFVKGEVISARISFDATNLRAPITTVTLSLLRIARVYAEHWSSLSGCTTDRREIAAVQSYGVQSGEAGDRVMELTVPEDCLASTSAVLVAISYQLVACMETDVWYENAYVSVPIEIFSSSARDPAQVLPEDFPPEYKVLTVSPPAYEEYQTNAGDSQDWQEDGECQWKN